MIVKISKDEDKLSDRLSSGRFASMYEAESITLGKDLKETIANLSQNKA
jgi:hypothetical protein